MGVYYGAVDLMRLFALSVGSFVIFAGIARRAGGPWSWWEGTGGVPKCKYVEYTGGVKELYNLDTDPYELTNSYNVTAPPADLVSRLPALKGCSGSGCFTAENGP